jgi:hypothetical protein
MKKSTVYVTYVNTDLTEGRGEDVPLCVCKLRSTAWRKGLEENVQGSNGIVKPVDLIEIEDENGNAKWYAPVPECVRIIQPNKLDLFNDNQDKKRQMALQKARDLGLTAEDIYYLTGGE